MAGSSRYYCLLISLTDLMKWAITQVVFQKVTSCCQAPSVLAQSLQRYVCLCLLDITSSADVRAQAKFTLSNVLSSCASG